VTVTCQVTVTLSLDLSTVQMPKMDRQAREEREENL
jgi:hypothetical protein